MLKKKNKSEKICNLKRDYFELRPIAINKFTSWLFETDKNRLA